MPTTYRFRCDGLRWAYFLSQEVSGVLTYAVEAEADYSASDLRCGPDGCRFVLRSHAGGAGEQVSAGIARGALAIRLNQLAAGGSGAAPAWLEAVASALNDGLVPEFRVLGAIGTGDLTGLAATALVLGPHFPSMLSRT